MHFLWLNVTFHDTVNMINDIIRMANPFPYAATHSCLWVLEIIKLNKSNVERSEYIHTVVVYQKYLIRLREILPTKLDIFDIRQHYVLILYICIISFWLETNVLRIRFLNYLGGYLFLL